MAFMFGATHWPKIEELAPDLDWIPHLDKIVHFSLYTGWVVVCWWVRTGGARALVSRERLTILAAGLLYACFDELTQGWVERYPSMADFLTDLLGLTCGLALAHVLPGLKLPWPGGERQESRVR